eukprot:CAMPEP_0175124264 /NCGR_PEP_ID=MMETSP0087-20121206/2688_1 /TAXON_ID=136419 /ORGANISM="Unknown Unknown, Strain D1" /LENGTH=44 /DNA_ID= /DNA_START= /DNA_END= /DNA_ORIENTATION=
MAAEYSVADGVQRDAYRSTSLRGASRLAQEEEEEEEEQTKKALL